MIESYHCKCGEQIAETRGKVTIIQAAPVHAVAEGLECTCRGCGEVNLIKTGGDPHAEEKETCGTGPVAEEGEKEEAERTAE